MTTLLTSLSEVVTQFMTWIGTVASTVVSTPILLIFFGASAIGAAISLFSRLVRG